MGVQLICNLNAGGVRLNVYNIKPEKNCEAIYWYLALLLEKTYNQNI